VADFSNAVFSTAAMTGARLDGSNFSGATFPRGEYCEPGSVGACQVANHRRERLEARSSALSEA
jgi:uncharacterized protein YjbI with pentapeptide repeats